MRPSARSPGYAGRSISRDGQRVGGAQGEGGDLPIRIGVRRKIEHLPEVRARWFDLRHRLLDHLQRLLPLRLFRDERHGKIEPASGAELGVVIGDGMALRAVHGSECTIGPAGCGGEWGRMVNEEECGSMRTREADDTKGVLVDAGVARNAVTPGKSSPSVYHKA